MKKINMNEGVKIKLTDYGLKILEDDFKRLKDNFPSITHKYTPPTIDKDGYTVMQLHCVMATFGQYFEMAMAEYPFDLDIVFIGY